MKKDKKERKPITIELAAAAQQAYAEASKRDGSAGGEKGQQLGLNSGWGGKGR